MKRISPNFIPSLLDLLPEMGPFAMKKDVGRVGFFFQDQLFGLVSAGQFWMRTDPEVCPVSGEPLPPTIQVLAEGGDYFMPVPEEVLKNKSTFQKWVLWATGRAGLPKPNTPKS